MANSKSRQQYHKEYIEKNADKLKEEYECEICGGKYQYMSKAHHIKTKKHIAGLELQKIKKENDSIKELISGMNKKIGNV